MPETAEDARREPQSPGARPTGSAGHRRLIAKDRIAAIILWCVALAIMSVPTLILVDILVRGLPELSLDFFVAEPTDAGRGGGIGTILVSTLLILAVTLAVALPLALATAVWLAEYTRRRNGFARIVRVSLDILAAVPSIVFGLFGNAVFCIALGMGYSILSGGLTLACMVLPILIRTAEQSIRAVPDDYRYAAASLGMSRTTTLVHVLLPTAARGLAAGLVLGIGRALAETAALIFTAGYVTRMPASVFDSGRAMSVHIYDLAMNVPGGDGRAYATAAILAASLLIINAVAVALTRVASSRNDDPVKVAQ